jgi:hypothetical protein
LCSKHLCGSYTPSGFLPVLRTHVLDVFAAGGAHCKVQIYLFALTASGVQLR